MPRFRISLSLSKSISPLNFPDPLEYPLGLKENRAPAATELQLLVASRLFSETRSTRSVWLLSDYRISAATSFSMSDKGIEE